ncbi:vomeromodulin-like [Castor canadensis]|uniref:Vomeromodulin-like n=1 Tax=Castor canadensis TaxID=51338 RepID=A0AC58MPM8_CASCN
MRTLWILAILLAFHVGALGQLETPPVVGRIPAVLPVPPPLPSQLSLQPVPLNVLSTPVLRSSSTQRSSPLRRPPTETPRPKCAPSARYFLSSSKLDDYLKTSLPPQIKQLVKCEEVNLAGLVGAVLSTLTESNLLSLLNLSSILNMGSALGIGGLLGQESGGKSSLPLLSKATGVFGGLLPLGQENLGNLLPAALGGDKNPAKGLLDSVSLPNLQQPLNDVVRKVGDLKESTQKALKGALPPGISNALSDMLGNANLEKLLINLQIQKVSVDNVDSTMTGEGIDVQAATTATIGGEGLIGPVVSLVGFKLYLDVTLNMALSTNHTQCIDLEVQKTDVQVKSVSLQIVETVTEILPVPLPLPLDKLVPKLLTVKIMENIEKSNSCGIALSDFNDCKNSTGLFKYQVKGARISYQGLSILYCAKALFDKNTVPVPEGFLPPDPKDVNISLIMSQLMIRKIVTHVAKQSSVQANNLDAVITKVTYTFQDDNTIQTIYWVKITKDGEIFATGKTI